MSRRATWSAAGARRPACGGGAAAAWLAGFAVLLSSCAATRTLPVALPELSAADLQAVLAHRREALRSLRSEATIAVSTPRGSASARQMIAVERPDRLRAEVFSPFGTVLAVVADQGRLAAYVREENVVYRGAASADNLRRWSGLDLRVADAVDLLLGGPPRREPIAAEASSEPATGRLRLRQETDAGAQVVLFSPEPPLPVEVQELDRDGTLLFRARLSEYREVSGIALATVVVFESPRAEQTVEIGLTDPEVNPALAPQLFLLPTPPGSREIPLPGGPS